MASLYEIAAYIGSACVDGRSNHGAWGYEKQFHATRESAEEAVARLRDGGHWGCSQAPTYTIVERTRADYANNAVEEQAWRRACRQAGISSEESRGLTLQPELPEVMSLDSTEVYRSRSPT